MKVDKVVVHNGKEYVSISEFAFRIGSTYQLVDKYIREGSLVASDVQKTGVKYLEWATQNVAYRIAKQKHAAKGGNGHKKRVVSPIMKEQSVKNPTVASPNLQIEDNSLQEITVNDSVIDLSKINPYEHKDCWIMNDGEPVTDPDGRPRLDYELLKTKVTVQTYQVKLDKETRSVIPKEEQLATVQGVCTVFKSSVDNIAQKYAAPLIAICESITKHEFTSEEHTQVMNVLRNVPKEIFPSIQKELEKMISDGETEI